MAGGERYTPEEDAFLRSCRDYVDYLNRVGATRFPRRGTSSFSRRRWHLGKRDDQPAPVSPSSDEPTTTTLRTDKKIGTFNWRNVAEYVSGLQQVRHDASWSQDETTIHLDTDRPVCIVTLSDAHLGAWSADHELFVRVTDEILSTPNLYVILLGDLLNMAIKLRGVSEVKDDLLPPELQHWFLEQWLEEIEHRVLLACWDNHAVEREETQAGGSVTARILSRRVVYHSGIGHADVRVGHELYKLAVSHHFRGRSMYNPVHGAQRYLVMQGHDREIAACGDSHVPGLLKFVHGGVPKVAINAGSMQVNSRYAKRYYSLVTHPIYPCFVLDPDRHCVTPYWAVGEWIAASRG